MFVSLSWRGSPPSMRPLKNGQMVRGSRLGFEYLPNTADWYGRWRLTQNPSNDWMIDRAAQKSGEIFTGIASIHGQDQAVTESMGGIIDHSFENLGPSDLMVARTRRRLLRAARALGEDGTLPPGVDDPEIYFEVRSGDFLADEKIAWRDAYAQQMRTAIRPLAQAAE
jgi:phthalate 4,5-dioxygenase